MLCGIFVEVEEELTRSVEEGRERAAAEGEDFCCRETAAAAESPREDRSEERGARRNAEENSLAVGVEVRGGRDTGEEGGILLSRR